MAGYNGGARDLHPYVPPPPPRHRLFLPGRLTNQIRLQCSPGGYGNHAGPRGRDDRKVRRGIAAESQRSCVQIKMRLDWKCNKVLITSQEIFPDFTITIALRVAPSIPC